MKNILLLFAAILISAQSFGQDPDLFQTWYLKSYVYDPGMIYYVNDVEPHISPTITIDPNLDFWGIAACNDYFGNFSDDPPFHLVLENFTPTISNCDYQAHDDFEADYFRYFELFPIRVYYLLYLDTSGNMSLLLEFYSGNIYNYQNFPLSISEQNLVQFDIYPNPVASELFIASENAQIENIRIYSISGKQVLDDSNFENSLDVSGLSEGVYFLEIYSSEGKSVQKFIKQ